MSDCENDHLEQEFFEIEDIIDVLLEREQSPKESVISSLLSFKSIITTKPIVSLMKNDIKQLEYNRSYNYYYENDEKIDEQELETQRSVNFKYYNKIFKSYIHNIVEITKKLSENKENDIAIYCIAESIDYVIKNMLDNAYEYIKNGRDNCLHCNSNKVYKILHFFSDIDKAHHFINLFNKSKLKLFTDINF
jgi:hypothetical protein